MPEPGTEPDPKLSATTPPAAAVHGVGYIEKENAHFFSFFFFAHFLSTQPLYGIPTPQLRSRLEKVQRRAARWVSNRHRQTSCVKHHGRLDALGRWPNAPLLRTTRQESSAGDVLQVPLWSCLSPSAPATCLNHRAARTAGWSGKKQKKKTRSYDIPSCRTQYRQMSFFPGHTRLANSLPGPGGHL